MYVYLPLTNNGNVERCPMNVTDNTIQVQITKITNACDNNK